MPYCQHLSSVQWAGLRLTNAHDGTGDRVSRKKTDLAQERTQQLAEWLSDGLRASNKSAAGLARDLGIHPSAVSKMMSGARAFQEHELPVISAYIGLPVPGGMVSAPPPMAVVQEIFAPAKVPVTVLIAPGLWKQKGASMLINEEAPISLDPRLQGIEQYACKALADGRYALCAPFAQLATVPRVNSMLHVVRTRNDQVEDTLRRVISTSSGLALATEGVSEPPLPLDQIRQAPEFEIKGVVVGYFTPETF